MVGRKLQWHPAFFAGLQIELQDDRENLIFENEHLLGTKPTQIDVLVIKKENNIPIRKNIGRIFRKYNIIEYKSPTDYLSVDDFYKGYAYVCFYKSLSDKEDAIRVNDMTLTFVCKGFPKKLVRHLVKVRKFQIRQREKGIYCMIGDVFPIQLIVTKELNETENLWLYSLTDELGDKKQIEYLLSDYKKHRHNDLYESVMDIVVRANEERFREVKDMCKALEELMKDELEEQKNMGISHGERCFATLTEKLLQDSRKDDLLRAINDRKFCRALYQEYGIEVEK